MCAWGALQLESREEAIRQREAQLGGSLLTCRTRNCVSTRGGRGTRGARKPNLYQCVITVRPKPACTKAEVWRCVCLPTNRAGGEPPGSVVVVARRGGAGVRG
jgi:hypothetical protein